MTPVVRARLFLPALLTALLLVAVLPLASGTAGAKPQSDHTATAETANGKDAEHKPERQNSQKPATPPSNGGESQPQDATEDNDTNDGDTPDGIVDDGDNAHPSGRDRSVEPGGSGTQGNATSDPDDDGNGPDRSNGGRDQADGPGGVDLADQDGNNGCGNDDDFEDDNEGRCRPTKTAVPDDVDEEIDEDDIDKDDDIVLGAPADDNINVSPVVPEFTRPMRGRNAETVPATVRTPATVTAPLEVAGELPVAPTASNVSDAVGTRSLAATGGSTMMLVVLTMMSMLLGSALLGSRQLALARIRRRGASDA